VHEGCNRIISRCSRRRVKEVFPECDACIPTVCRGDVPLRGVPPKKFRTCDTDVTSSKHWQGRVEAMTPPDIPRTISLGGCRVALTDSSVAIGDAEPVVLIGRERQLLDALLTRPGVVFSKQSLLRSIWGGRETGDHVVEVTIGRLRRRLGPAGSGIETVIRRGYRAQPS
jgi:DNA-binding response OmpR family regulator